MMEQDEEEEPGDASWEVVEETDVAVDYAHVHAFLQDFTPLAQTQRQTPALPNPQQTLF